MEKKENGLIRLMNESGLTQEKTVALGEQLTKFFNLAVEWDEKINELVITDPNQVPEMKIARETRLMLKKYRLDAIKLIKQNRDILKEQMSDQILLDKLYLNAGKMISATFENLETKLEQKEKFAERWETEQKQILRGERLTRLEPFTDDATIYPVENMSEQQFNDLLNGLKAQHEQKLIEAEKQREEMERMNFQNEMLRRQNLLLNAGLTWTGTVFKFETLEITPDKLTELTTEQFNKEFEETRVLIREIINEKNRQIEQLKQVQQTPTPTPEKHFNTIATPEPTPEPEKIVVSKNITRPDNPAEKYVEQIKNLKLDIFFGNMPLEMDLTEKFEGFKKWALNRINEFY